MRISELAERAGLSVATVKFYLREGLLMPGHSRSATQSDYDDAHLARLRLIRALAEVGGLSLASVRDVLQAIGSDPQDVATAVGTAHEALGAAHRSAGVTEPVQALAVLAQLGWTVWPDSSAVRQLDAALTAAAGVGLPTTPERMRVYADAALQIAVSDIATVPQGSPDATAAYVVLGTVLYEPVLLALRRLAQQQVYSARAGQDGDSGPAPVAGTAPRNR